MWNPFRRASIKEIVARQLADAQLNLMQAKTDHEWSVCKLTLYQHRVSRLEAELSALPLPEVHWPVEQDL